jgi:hypothetical protein
VGEEAFHLPSGVKSFALAASITVLTLMLLALLSLALAVVVSLLAALAWVFSPTDS